MARPPAQLWMFHFRRPLCGSAPGATPLREYLSGWRNADRAQVSDLLATTAAALIEVCGGTTRWMTKKIRRELERFWSATEAFARVGRTSFRSHLTRTGARTLAYETACVFCYSSSGPRTVDNYFTGWADACKVQTGNLLYEVGLVLWTVVSSVPRWADGATVRTMSDARLALHAAGRALGLLICPQCGRPTTALGGGTSAPEADGHCRWCSDMGGGFGFRISLVTAADGTAGVELDTGDGKAAGRSDRDLLPPEVTAVWDAIEAKP